MTVPLDGHVAAGWRGARLDGDPQETQEWLDVFDGIIAWQGGERASYIPGRLWHALRSFLRVEIDLFQGR